MSLRFTVAICVVALWVAGQAAAQQDITVQLPTFNYTTVQTTVNVPDGGTALLGGIGRASEGSVSRGVPVLGKIPGVSRLFNNRGIGREMGLSQMTLTPRIIIQEEEEFRQTGVSSELLSHLSAAPNGVRPLAVAGGRPAEAAVTQKADFIARNVARHPAAATAEEAGPAPPSLEQIRRQNELAGAQRAAEAEGFFAKGQRAEAEGKSGVAKIWYQMAARRAQGELQQEVAKRLATLDGSAASQKLAGR